MNSISPPRMLLQGLTGNFPGLIGDGDRQVDRSEVAWLQRVLRVHRRSEPQNS